MNTNKFSKNKKSKQFTDEMIDALIENPDISDEELEELTQETQKKLDKLHKSEIKMSDQPDSEGSEEKYLEVTSAFAQAEKEAVDILGNQMAEGFHELMRYTDDIKAVNEMFPDGDTTSSKPTTQ